MRKKNMYRCLDARKRTDYRQNHREFLINLRRAHCLRLLFAFSLTFDTMASGKCAEFHLSVRTFQQEYLLLTAIMLRVFFKIIISISLYIIYTRIHGHLESIRPSLKKLWVFFNTNVIICLNKIKHLKMIFILITRK